MINAVPLRSSGGLLNANKKEIPSTEPGIIKGNMVMVSRALLRVLFLRTVR